MTDDVRYPQLRADVLDAIEALADTAYQARAWRDGDVPAAGPYESFDMVVHALYDDAQLDEGAEDAVGDVLRDAAEATALDNVIRALEAVFAELGSTDVGELDVMAAAGWPPVVHAAKVAVARMQGPAA